MKKKYSAPNTKFSAVMAERLLNGFSIATTADGPKVVTDETVDPGQALSKHKSVWDEDEDE